MWRVGMRQANGEKNKSKGAPIDAIPDLVRRYDDLIILIVSITWGCLLLASCSKPNRLMEQDADRVRNLCDYYREDLFKFSQEALNAHDSAGRDYNLERAKGADKFMSMLNCKRWNPS